MKKPDTKYLEKRNDTWYFRKRVAGQMVRFSLETTDVDKAIKRRDEELLILTARGTAKRRRALLHAIDDDEQEAAVRERTLRDRRILVSEAWDRARSSPQWVELSPLWEQCTRTWWEAWRAFITGRRGSEVRLAEVTRDDAVAYGRHVKSITNKARTYNAQMAAVKKLWRILEAEEDIGDPWRTLRARPSDSTGQRELSLDEVRQVMAAAKGEWKTLVVIGYHTWMRLKNCALIQWSDIDLDAGWIRTIHYKTGSPAVIPLHAELRAALEERETPRKGDVLPEIATVYRRHASTISVRFKALLQKAGIETQRPNSKKGSPPLVGFQSLRHTGSTASTMAGNAPAVTQAIRGDTTMTQQSTYIHVGEAALREAIQRIPSIDGERPPTDSERLAAVLKALEGDGKPAEVLARARAAAGL